MCKLSKCVDSLKSYIENSTFLHNQDDMKPALNGVWYRVDLRPAGAARRGRVDSLAADWSKIVYDFPYYFALRPTTRTGQGLYFNPDSSQVLPKGAILEMGKALAFKHNTSTTCTCTL